LMLPASVLLRDVLVKLEKQRWASLWTNPPSPRPARWVFWPHEMSNKVSNKLPQPLQKFHVINAATVTW